MFTNKANQIALVYMKHKSPVQSLNTSAIVGKPPQYFPGAKKQLYRYQAMSQSGTPTANIHPHDEEHPIHVSGAASIVKLAQKGLRHSLHRGSEDVTHDIKTFQSIYVPSNFPAKPKKREEQTPFSSFVQ